MSEGQQNLSSQLQDLQSNHGLQLAAVVGLDGLVIDAASDGNVDAELISAVAAPGLLMMGDLANELGEDLAELTTLEYRRHVAVLLPLDENSLLVVVAESGAMNLGQLRIILRRSMNDLRNALESI